ncbi:MAG: class I SAM-dependent methyltransferase [Vicinamibacterales bacterium]
MVTATREGDAATRPPAPRNAEGPVRQAVAVGLGALVGLLPLHGVHAPLVRGLGRVTGLPPALLGLGPRSTPAMLIPVLLLAQVEIGAWMRHGAPHLLASGAATTVTPTGVLMDLIAGALFSGGLLGLAAGIQTFITLRHRTGDPVFDALAADAGRRYGDGSMTLWQFANGKLRFDPVYRDALRSLALPHHGTLVDVGCSQGLMLALLAAARAAPPEAEPVPRFQTLVGIELRPRVAAQARRALGAAAIILEADVTATPMPRADAVLVFDVLHLLSADAQRRFVDALFAAIRPGGTLIVRRPMGAGSASRSSAAPSPEGVVRRRDQANAPLPDARRMARPVRRVRVRNQRRQRSCAWPARQRAVRAAPSLSGRARALC